MKKVLVEGTLTANVMGIIEEGINVEVMHPQTIVLCKVSCLLPSGKTVKMDVTEFLQLQLNIVDEVEVMA